MPKVQRTEILDFLTYGEQRDRIRAEAMAAKALRRVHLGKYLTFLFENRTTIRYQILEMMRAEQIVKESQIQHELDTYNAVPGVTPVASVTSRGNSLGNNFASTTAGKPANSPFTSTVGFATYLATIFPLSGSPSFTQIMTAIGPMLTVRSDTFRVRAYGEALNPVPEPGQTVGKVEATAYCEAVVQRTPQTMPGFGRRFVITYFRWLGPDDI